MLINIHLGPGSERLLQPALQLPQLLVTPLHLEGEVQVRGDR